MNNLFSLLSYTCNSAACSFDRTPTVAIILFEIFVVTITIILLILFSKTTKKILLRYGIMALGVIIFEFFTRPMWNNLHMGKWAYLYRDVSWILTLGWSTLILTFILLIDSYLPKAKEIKKFSIYLIVLTIITVLFESLVIQIGIRSYSPEVLDVINNKFIPILNVPIQIFYYVPVFIGLIIGFYKYLNFIIDRKILVPVNKAKLFRNFIIATIAVFMFEIMIEPMVTNAKFPQWSYIYRDISLIQTFGWVLIIWLATMIVDKYFIHFTIIKRLVCYLGLIGIISLPAETWLIKNGFRIYGPSAMANFSGFLTPWFNVPVEISFAIPFYLVLVIGFIRYWESVFDNKL